MGFEGKKSLISEPEGTLQEKIQKLEIQLDIAVSELDFETAAEIRDQILLLNK